MADALARFPLSPQNFNEIKPTTFHWPVFLAGFGLMTWAVWRATWVNPRQHNNR
jgi:hypothetical protein